MPFNLLHDNSSSRWPRPSYDHKDQPHFLFIITPPRSGSTALAGLLNTSYRATTLHHTGEGQWLVPGLCDVDRWSPSKKVNYQSVKASWLSAYQRIKRLDHHVDVVIEKSPPNMMRIKWLASLFRSYSLIANNRNPYAFCASTLYRRHRPDNLRLDGRINALKDIVKAWVFRSQKIRELVSSLKVPLLTYEEFCHDPSLLFPKLQLPDGVSETIDLDAAVKVKDYQPRTITNQNPRQISRLGPEEIVLISESLDSYRPLLDFFGYSLLQ